MRARVVLTLGAVVLAVLVVYNVGVAVVGGPGPCTMYSPPNGEPHHIGRFPPWLIVLLALGGFAAGRLIGLWQLGRLPLARRRSQLDGQSAAAESPRQLGVSTFSAADLEAQATDPALTVAAADSLGTAFRALAAARSRARLDAGGQQRPLLAPAPGSPLEPATVASRRVVWSKVTVQIAVIAFLTLCCVALAYETYAAIRFNHPWTISYIVRCANNGYSTATLLTTLVVATALGYWFWFPGIDVDVDASD